MPSQPFRGGRGAGLVGNLHCGVHQLPVVAAVQGHTDLKVPRCSRLTGLAGVEENLSALGVIRRCCRGFGLGSRGVGVWVLSVLLCSSVLGL